MSILLKRQSAAFPSFDIRYSIFYGSAVRCLIIDRAFYLLGFRVGYFEFG
jgi:hypothetical protein